MLTEITVPDLGTGADATIAISAWLVKPGEEVIVGDRVVELLLGEITFDVASPVSGRLVQVLIEADEPVAVGSVLGMIEPKPLA